MTIGSVAVKRYLITQAHSRASRSLTLRVPLSVAPAAAASDVAHLDRSLVSSGSAAAAASQYVDYPLVAGSGPYLSATP